MSHLRQSKTNGRKNRWMMERIRAEDVDIASGYTTHVNDYHHYVIDPYGNEIGPGLTAPEARVVVDWLNMPGRPATKPTIVQKWLGLVA